jgi:energy-coupling factor transporter ATP-binding protein EcfA2
MKISQINIKKFKRFHDLTIQALPTTTRLVILAGPNGCGKSSLFDALLVFHKRTLAQYIGYGPDKNYHFKVGLPEESNWFQLVNVAFEKALPMEEKALRKLFYFRSAYRNEADFTINSIQRFDVNHEQNRLQRLIDNDVTVSINYQKLVSETVSRLYAGAYDSETVKTLREELISQVSDSMKRLFGDLSFTGPGNPLEEGTFFFTKGISQNFHYKNLSAGEKAAFDLLLDLITRHWSSKG